jgi:GNAT superfamily N-acetyltransferase
MAITDGCLRLSQGSKSTKTVELVDCPNCDVKTQIADHSGGYNYCINCEAGLGAEVEVVEEMLPVFTCNACGATTPTLHEKTGTVGDIEVLNCSGENCERTIAANCDDSTFQPYSTILQASWVQGAGNIPAGVAVQPVEAVPEQAVVQLLNLEAKTEERTFRLYSPDSSNALLVYHNGDVAGYLTWNVAGNVDDRSAPAVFRQVFVLPAKRRQGLATTLVETFLNTVATDRADGEYVVEGANTSTLRVLDSMGEVSYEVTDKGIKNIDTKQVTFTKSNPFQKLATELR